MKFGENKFSQFPHCIFLATVNPISWREGTTIRYWIYTNVIVFWKYFSWAKWDFICILCRLCKEFGFFFSAVSEECFCGVF